MNALQSIAAGEDACGRHSPAYYHKAISEFRDALANAHGLILAQQASIAFLERQLAARTSAHAQVVLDELDIEQVR